MTHECRGYIGDLQSSQDGAANVSVLMDKGEFTMSQSDNFLTGFLLGSLVGGLAGGVLGVVVSSRRSSTDAESQFTPPLDKESRKRKLTPPTEESIEAARQGLEEKIAQLNDAIDDVRQQLSSVNNNGGAEADDAIADS